MTAIPVIDGHHHIWRLADLPWLSGPVQPRIFGAYEAIRRDYTTEEFRAAAEPEGVVASVYVQTNWPAAGAVDEVAWVQAEGERTGWPHAIVGYADFADPEVARVLDAQMRHDRFRGVRQQLHWHENPLYRFAPRPDVMNDPPWRRGFAEVGKRGLLFELQLFSGQMADGVALVRAFPETQFVLEHAGMLADTAPGGVAAWRAGMRALAAEPNVAVKLSALGTFIRRCSIQHMRPIVLETVELFGPDRCLWGSNMPIESLWTEYRTLAAAIRATIAPLPEAARRAILHDTAARLYRIAA